MAHNEELIHIFWTAGMDSTFRLIQLLLTTKQIIQPHYIIGFEERNGVEIDTMLHLRKKIILKYPNVKDRFLHTNYINQGLIKNDYEIACEISLLREECIVTDQYIYMANYCKAFNINRIEVAITKETTLQPKWIHYLNCNAFNYFEYPIADLTKKDIVNIAIKNKWWDILTGTTFCHRPIKKIYACGICGPCNDAVMAGMGFRLPMVTRIKAKVLIPFRKFWRKNYLEQKENKLLLWVGRNFRNRF